MQIALILTMTCPCGAPAEGVMIRTVRINKNSMRTLGQGFGFMPRVCKACKAALPDTITVTYRIADDDMGRINAYRERKGWPLLTLADASRQAEG